MKARTLLTAVLVMGIACIGWSQQKKTRDWQEGVLLSVEKTKELDSSTTTTDTEGKVKQGDKYSEQSTATKTQNYDYYAIYAVQAGNIVYTARQHLLFSFSKPANIALGEKLKYAVEKDKLYMLDDDGKEFSAKIVKKAMKDAQ
jgi:hypothetical protein